MQDKNNLYIVDPIKGNTHVPTVFAPTVLLASGRASNIETFRRQKECNVTPYTMPAWTFDEVMGFKKHTSKKEMNDDDFIRHFEDFGGTPRLLFEKKSTEYIQDFKALRWSAAQNLDDAALRNVECGEVGDVGSDMISSKLFQVLSDESFIRCGTDFVSKGAQIAVVAVNAKKIQRDLSAGVKIMDYNKVSDKLEFGILCFLSTKMEWRVRSLEDASAFACDWTSAAEMPKDLSNERLFQEWRALKQSERNPVTKEWNFSADNPYVLRPKSKKFPFADAVLAKDVCVNVTANVNHKMSLSAALTVYNNLFGLDCVSNRAQMPQLKLIWAVTGPMYRKFKKQGWEDNGKNLQYLPEHRVKLKTDEWADGNGEDKDKAFALGMALAGKKPLLKQYCMCPRTFLK